MRGNTLAASRSAISVYLGTIQFSGSSDSFAGTGCGAARLLAKSLYEKDFCEVIGVPGSEQSFILDSKLSGFVVLQRAQSEAANHAEVDQIVRHE